MQQLNPSEISDIIKQRIERLDVTTEEQNVGTLVSVSMAWQGCKIKRWWSSRAACMA